MAGSAGDERPQPYTGHNYIGSAGDERPQRVYEVTTVGAPAAHAMKFKREGCGLYQAMERMQALQVEEGNLIELIKVHLGHNYIRHSGVVCACACMFLKCGRM